MLRDALHDAMRYWVPRRFPYNVALAILTSAWVLLTWPHFRPAFTLQPLSKLLILAALVNVGYCAAYLADMPIQQSVFGNPWRR